MKKRASSADLPSEPSHLRVYSASSVKVVNTTTASSYLSISNDLELSMKP